MLLARQGVPASTLARPASGACPAAHPGVYQRLQPNRGRNFNLATSATPTDERSKTTKEAEEATKKFGLEAGLLKVFSSDKDNKVSKADQAKQLLAKYGSAYLITSISFAIVSFGTCYTLVNAGINVADLLSGLGLQVNQTNEQVGTFAIAYAAHKALSPVRFPPTVALTPVVAKWIGKKEQPSEEKGQ